MGRADGKGGDWDVWEAKNIVNKVKKRYTEYVNTGRSRVGPTSSAVSTPVQMSVNASVSPVSVQSGNQQPRLSSPILNVQAAEYKHQSRSRDTSPEVRQPQPEPP